MKLRHIILSSALVAALAACSASPSATDPSASPTGGSAASPDVSVEGGFGEDPKISFDSKVEPPVGLEIKDLVEGDGEEVKPGATVEVHYKGVSWVNGGVEFDSSFSRGETISFPLNGVIPGWRDGLVGQKVNGRRLLVIPPEMGYGAQSPTPAIAPNDTLVFVVDLVSVQNP